jgi:hypothetical protein
VISTTKRDKNGNVKAAEFLHVIEEDVNSNWSVLILEWQM